MKKGFALFLSVLLFCSPAFAAQSKKFNPFTSKFDYIGVDDVGQVTVVCAAGKILKSSGAGVWTCQDDDSGAGATPGTVRVSEDGTFVVSADTLNFTTGIKATGSGTKVTVSGDVATTTTLGIASFDTAVFTVRNDGGVSTKALTGDVTTSAGGVATTIAADAVALATDTTGAYVATLADDGTTTVTVTGSGAENAAVTLKVVDLSCTNCIGPTEITDLALGTDTSGNYAAGDAEAGAALGGDTATAFFSTGVLEVGIGGTGVTSISNDAVLVGNNAGNGFDKPALPNCVDSGGSHLNYTTATGVFTCGTTGDGTGSGGGGFMIRVSEDGTFIADNGNRQMNLDMTGGITGSVVTSGDTVTVSLDTVTVARGGTNLTDVSNDAVLIGNNAGTGFDKPRLPDCGTGATDKLLYTQSTGVFSCGTDQNSGGSKPAKEYWWPASATLPLEAVGDSIPPITKLANAVSFDELGVAFDSATPECRTVNFKIPPDVTSGGTVAIMVDFKNSVLDTGNVIWSFRHNNGTAPGVSTDVAATVVTAAAQAVQTGIGKISRANWVTDTTTAGWAASDDVMGVFCREGSNGSDTASQDSISVGFGVSIPRT